MTPKHQCLIISSVFFLSSYSMSEIFLTYNSETLILHGCSYTLYLLSVTMKKKTFNPNLSLCRLILEREGPRSLFRGLGPNLVGVAPSRFVQYYLQYSLGVLSTSMSRSLKQYGENIRREAKRKGTENNSDLYI